MARIRTIKPEFWQDEKLAPLPAIDRLVFLGLISQADDAGRLVDNPRLLDGLIFPETDESSRNSLETLQRLGRIIRYSSESGQHLIQIVGWKKHQNVQKPSTYVLPGPPENGHSGDIPETSRTVSGDFPSPIPDPRSTTNDLLPTDAVSNETGGKSPPQNVDNSTESVREWLGRFMPLLREQGFDADEHDGSILKAIHKKRYPADDVEAAIRGVALMKARGGLSAFADCKLSMRLLYAAKKPGAPPDRRPLWNEAVELYHQQTEQRSRGDPNAQNAIATVLQRMQTGAA